VVRFFHNVIICRSIPRFSFFGGSGGIVHCPARVDAFYPAALSRLPARYGPRLRMDLNRVAKLPANGPPRKATDPDQSPDLSRPALDYVMDDFSIRMNNRLRFSNCKAPHIPTSKQHDETLAVELRGDLLTITERRADGGFGSRIYAQRIIDLPEACIFTILPELPSHVRDGSFFPALGTVAILAARGGEQRRLRAVGTDKNSGRCHGWIFDAIEEEGSGSTRS
jgi:hypothetical protein